MRDNNALLPHQQGDPPTTAEVHPVQIDPDFDESAYLRAYADVAAAVQRGELGCGYDHYLLAGRTEGRLAQPQYRQYLILNRSVLGEFKTTVEAAHAPEVSIEALIVSNSGAIFIVGWTDDRDNPLVAITVRVGQDTGHSCTGFPRLRRRDAEASLHVTGAYQHGFWAFVGADDMPGARHTPRRGQCALELCYSNGAIVELTRVPHLVPDTEMRDNVMSYFAACEYSGNRAIEAFMGLDHGTGDTFIGFNKSIGRSFGSQALVERFGQTQRRAKVSIIVPILGIADYFFLQSCFYARSRNIAAYEFIYVVNSPELIEPLCREARIAEMIYGLAQTLVLLPGNAGFGAANNIAARFARSDRLLCVNPDVFPRDPDWANRHLDVLANLPEAQTRLFGTSLYYDDGSLMHGGMYFEVDAGFHTTDAGTTRRTLARVEHYGKGAPPWATQYAVSRPVPAVTGAFMSIDRGWFEKLGGFTEDYVFGHYEDADLCLKSLFAGTPAWLHDIPMWHLEGKGSRRLPQHEGGSLVNRWHFSRTWLPKIVPDVIGRTPQHRLLRATAPTTAGPTTTVAPTTGPTTQRPGAKRTSASAPAGLAKAGTR